MHEIVLQMMERILCVVFLPSESNCDFITAKNTNSTLEYLRLTHVDLSFAISILQQIIKDIRVSHAECINNKRIFFNYKADGLEMTLTEV